MTDKIFLDKTKLLPQFVPPSLPHRTDEIKALASNFRSLFSRKAGGAAVNQATIVVVLGGPGNGKTALVKYTTEHVASLAKRRNRLIRTLFVNCWQHRSMSAILTYVRRIFSPDAAIKGFSLEEQVSATIMPHLESEDAHLILTLDEVNALGSDDVNSLFSIVEEFGESGRISLVFISRPTEWHMLASQELNQRLTDSVTLYPYTLEQLVDILNYRASLALEPTTYDDEMVELASEIAYNDHNVRLGLEVLYRAGEIAEQQGEVELSAEVIRKAKGLVFPELRAEILGELRKHELLVLMGVARRLIYKRFTTLNMKDAFRYYRMVCEEWGEPPKKDSSFRTYLITLKSLGLINLVVGPMGRGRKGIRSRISITDVPASIVIERVEEQLKLIEEL